MLTAAPAFALHPGARPGEAFTFKFSLGPVEGGRARMSIGRPMARHGRRVLAVHGQAETTSFVKLLAHMDDDYKLVVDTGNLLPVSVAETERGVRERRINVVQRRRAHRRRRLLVAASGSSACATLPPRITRDPLSGFFALRALPLDDEQSTLDLDILDGNALWRVRARRPSRRQRAPRQRRAAAHAAIRIDGVARRIEDNGRPRAGMGPRNLTIWLSRRRRPRASAPRSRHRSRPLRARADVVRAAGDAGGR